MKVRPANWQVELGVVIGKTAKNVTLEHAMDYIAGYLLLIGRYTLAIDVTARTLQTAAKAKGLPWTEAKGFILPSLDSFSYARLRHVLPNLRLH